MSSFVSQPVTLGGTQRGSTRRGFLHFSGLRVGNHMNKKTQNNHFERCGIIYLHIFFKWQTPSGTQMIHFFSFNRIPSPPRRSMMGLLKTTCIFSSQHLHRYISLYVLLGQVLSLIIFYNSYNNRNRRTVYLL